MWFDFVIFSCGSIAGFLGGALLTNIKHENDRLHVLALVDTVRDLLTEHPPSEEMEGASLASVTIADMAKLRLALREFDASYFGIETNCVWCYQLKASRSPGA